ncbi:MAG: protease pro-enzyme activation domain-containing protein [Polyangiaceae bacterium]
MNLRSRLPLVLAVSTLAACSSSPGADSSAPPQQAGSTASTQSAPGLLRLAGHVPSLARTTPIVRHLDPATPLSLAIGLPLRDPEGLRVTAAQVADPSSPSYRHYLTPEEVTARFAPTESDYAALVAFARASGLTVAQTFPNRILATVSGAAGDVERALHVTLSVHRRPDGTEFFAPDDEPMVDAAVPIEHVAGLDDAMPVRRLGGGSWSNGSFDSKDLRSTYAGCELGLTGAGQTLGLIEIGNFQLSDLESYASGQSITRVPTNVITIAGGPTSNVTEPDFETTGDIEVANGMAPGMKEIDVFELPSETTAQGTAQAAFDTVFGTITTMSGRPNIVSMSVWPSYIDSTLLSAIQIMGTQGQSLVVASGDDGSGNYPSENMAIAPGVTLVAGTQLSLNPYSEVAMNFFSNGEHFWNGGGIESDPVYVTQTALPSYQEHFISAASGASSTNRNVPDVSMVGENVHIVINAETGATFGGTSASAPEWAGYLALVNQASVANGLGVVGFVNPAMYYQAYGEREYDAHFNDVTSGTNGAYDAVTGYDLVTGLGTPQCALIGALSTKCPANEVYIDQCTCPVLTRWNPTAGECVREE